MAGLIPLVPLTDRHQIERWLGPSYLAAAERELMSSLTAIVRAYTVTQGGGIEDMARLALSAATLLVAADLDRTETWDETRIRREIDHASLGDLLAVYAARCAHRRHLRATLATRPQGDVS